MPGSIHQQMRNDRNTKRKMDDLKDGYIGLFLITDKRK
jgi:hypothetical protein